MTIISTFINLILIVSILLLLIIITIIIITIIIITIIIIITHTRVGRARSALSHAERARTLIFSLSSHHTLSSTSSPFLYFSSLLPYFYISVFISNLSYLREGPHYQMRSSQGGGVSLNPKIFVADFGSFKQAFLSMKLIQKSNYRAQS